MSNYPSDNANSFTDSDQGNVSSRSGYSSSYRPQSRRIPISPTQSTIVVTYVILAVTVLTFGIQFLSKSTSGIDYPVVYGAKINQAIIEGQYWRLLTPVLLHASILHLGFNMYALYVLGPGLERYYGYWRFLTLYLLAGFAGNVLSFIFTPAPSLGASTAIFGLLGAQGVFLLQNREMFGKPAQRALINLVIIAGINLVFGLSPGIDNWGHIGGLLGGSLFAWFAGPVLNVTGEYPDITIADSRSNREVVRTGLIVAILFGTLAAVTIILRS